MTERFFGTLVPLYPRVDEALKAYLGLSRVLEHAGHRVDRVVPEGNSPLPRVEKGPVRIRIHETALDNLSQDPEKAVADLLRIRLPKGNGLGIGRVAAPNIVKALKIYRSETERGQEDAQTTGVIRPV